MKKIKLKNPILCMLVFIIACVMLGWAYWKVSAKATTISTIQEMIKPIIAGIIGTVLVFWSLSGFILKLVQSNKKDIFKRNKHVCSKTVKQQSKYDSCKYECNLLNAIYDNNSIINKFIITKFNEKRYRRNDTSRYKLIQTSKY